MIYLCFFLRVGQAIDQVLNAAFLSVLGHLRACVGPELFGLRQLHVLLTWYGSALVEFAVIVGRSELGGAALVQLSIVHIDVSQGYGGILRASFEALLVALCFEAQAAPGRVDILIGKALRVRRALSREAAIGVAT